MAAGIVNELYSNEDLYDAIMKSITPANERPIAGATFHARYNAFMRGSLFEVVEFSSRIAERAVIILPVVALALSCAGLGQNPFGFAIIVIASAVFPVALIVFLVAGKLTERQTSRPGCCPVCGYDLRASPKRCPECGTYVT